AGSAENHLENRRHRATLGVEHQEWRDQRPATAREATVPWLNESRCAREDLENASHGQADCLAFFICPWCVPTTETRTHQCQFSRIGFKGLSRRIRPRTSTSSTITRLFSFI